MDKLWLVAKYEYLTNVRKRSFLIASLGVPLFVIVLMVIIFAVTAAQFDIAAIGAVGYVDASGILADELDQPDTFQTYADETAARAALDADEIGAYFVVPADYEASGRITIYAGASVPGDLRRQIEGYLIANIGATLDPVLLERLQNPVTRSLRTLNNGRTITEAGLVGLFITPIIFVMIFAMGSQTTSGYLMSGVVEEKSNRVMEILITSIPPFQLLAGKIIGLGLLGLTQLGIWAVVSGVIAAISGNITALRGVSLPPDLLLLGLVYFVLSYFMQASIMAGVGAVAGGEQESRQLAGVLSLIFFLPLFFFVNFITEPNGTIPTILTLIPFTAPVAVITRASFGTVPPSELVASLMILIVTTILIVWVSARVFRWSLLMYGKRPSLRQMLGALRSNRIETTAGGETMP
ncbi:MAG: ABC transporter permease [Chloroflexota bacterium]|nr:ABC transporter permease [Chloroflexota bacterium]